MTTVSIVITGCSERDFQDFASRSQIPSALTKHIEKEKQDLVLRIPADKLESFYHTMEKEAREGWRTPASEEILRFDSAFFPQSAVAVLPVRELRGAVAAKLSAKKASLPPAYASPGFVFDTAETV